MGRAALVVEWTAGQIGRAALNGDVSRIAMSTTYAGPLRRLTTDVELLWSVGPEASGSSVVQEAGSCSARPESSGLAVGWQGMLIGGLVGHSQGQPTGAQVGYLQGRLTGVQAQCGRFG